jgi:hypothetical protein
MDTILTAAVTLVGVFLGGWLTVWNQDRIARRDQARQWRDIRLAAYQDFLYAYRRYLAYAQDPDAKIQAVQHPHRDDLMPFFDAEGRPYKEELEAARMRAVLVSGQAETRDAVFLVMRRVRSIAAARAEFGPDNFPEKLFPELFIAHNKFMTAARRELGLADMPGDL